MTRDNSLQFNSSSNEESSDNSSFNLSPFLPPSFSYNSSGYNSSSNYNNNTYSDNEVALPVIKRRNAPIYRKSEYETARRLRRSAQSYIHEPWPSKKSDEQKFTTS